MTPEHLEAREEQLAKSSPYVPGPFHPGHYSVGQRDTYHFDIYAERRPGYVQDYYHQYPNGVAWPMTDGAKERAFAIRGEPGNIYIRDERWDKERPYPRDLLKFSCVGDAMVFVHYALMGLPA